MWFGRQENGILHFPTYTYTNLNGAGNSNFYKNLSVKNRHTKWFFVYFGYSKFDKKAFAYVQWHDSREGLQYTNVNHYYAEKFFVFIGKDTYHNSWNGKIAHFRLNLGEGAYREKDDFKHGDDAFGFDIGFEDFDEDTEEDEEEKDDGTIPSAHDDQDSI